MELYCWKLGGEVTQQVEPRGVGGEKDDIERKRDKCLRRKKEQEEEGGSMTMMMMMMTSDHLPRQAPTQWQWGEMGAGGSLAGLPR